MYWSPTNNIIATIKIFTYYFIILIPKPKIKTFTIIVNDGHLSNKGQKQWDKSMKSWWQRCGYWLFSTELLTADLVPGGR